LTFIAEAHVPTLDARRYVLQLGNYWAYDLKVEENGEVRWITFPKDACEANWPGDALVTLAPQKGALVCRIEASALRQRDGVKGAVARHVGGFASREAPLVYDWQNQPQERD
jgi:hypothetical protein